MGIEQSDYGVPRADLGAALEEYKDSESNYIGDLVLPDTPVDVEGGKYSAIVRESLTARAKTKRGDNGRYSRIGLKTEDVTFACEEHGLEGPVSDKQRKRYQNDFDAELATGKKTLSTLMREQEIRTAGLVFDTAVWTGAALYTDVTTVWSNIAATIVKDVEAARAKVNAGTGMEANTLILNRNNYAYLLSNTEIVGRVGNARDKGQSEVANALANILGIDKILVGRGVYNTKPQGATAYVGSQIWDDSYAMVAYVPDSNDATEPAIGRTFRWTEDCPTNPVTESYIEPQTRSTVVRVRQNLDEKIIDAYFGHLLKID